MMKHIAWAFLASTAWLSSNTLAWSVHDDIDVYPRYDIIFSEDSIPASEADALLSTSPKITVPSSSAEANDKSTETTYHFLRLKETPYLCAIPRPAPPAHNETAEALARQAESDEVARAATVGAQLLTPLDERCLFFNGGWWSYLYCHNKVVTQFHAAHTKVGEPRWPLKREKGTPLFVLGKARGAGRRDEGGDSAHHDGDSQQMQASTGDVEHGVEEGGPIDPRMGAAVPSQAKDGEKQKTIADNKHKPAPREEAHTENAKADPEAVIPDLSGVLAPLSAITPKYIQTDTSRYLSLKWSHGTLCDITFRPRTIEIQFHCSLNDEERISYIKEVTTCNYLLVIHTPRLCVDKAFTPPEGESGESIVCRPVAEKKAIESGTDAPSEADIDRIKQSLKAGANEEDDASEVITTEEVNPRVVIGGTVVGGGIHLPLQDPPLLPLPKGWHHIPPGGPAAGAGDATSEFDSGRAAVGATTNGKGEGGRATTESEVAQAEAELLRLMLEAFFPGLQNAVLGEVQFIEPGQPRGETGDAFEGLVQDAVQRWMEKQISESGLDKGEEEGKKAEKLKEKTDATDMPKHADTQQVLSEEGLQPAQYATPEEEAAAREAELSEAAAKIRERFASKPERRGAKAAMAEQLEKLRQDALPKKPVKGQGKAPPSDQGQGQVWTKEMKDKKMGKPKSRQKEDEERQANGQQGSVKQKKKEKKVEDGQGHDGKLKQKLDEIRDEL